MIYLRSPPREGSEVVREDTELCMLLRALHARLTFLSTLILPRSIQLHYIHYRPARADMVANPIPTACKGTSAECQKTTAFLLWVVSSLVIWDQGNEKLRPQVHMRMML